MEKVETNNLIYLLNKNDKTAIVIGSSMNNVHSEEIIIPSTIIVDSTSYNIVRIARHAFKTSLTIKSIRFSEDSKIHTIEEFAFCFSAIASITIPPSLIELEEGWCSSTQSLTNISVMKNNPRYLNYDGKYIIGKSSIEHENFDVLIFCNRDVKTAKIPNFIEIIGPYAFEQCFDLQKVEIPNDSKLRKICKNSFSFSSIEQIFIPPHITFIGERAFFSCFQLRQVEILENSELQIIDKEAFNKTSIESITIPSNLIELREGWCGMTNSLNRIKIMENNKRYSLYENSFIIEKSSIENENFDTLIFAFNKIKIAKIPNFIEIIAPKTFYGLTNIQKVEFSNDSKLKIIDKMAFCCTMIKKISLPPFLTHINELAFSSCFELQRVDIPTNSMLQFIGEKAFFNSPILCISIPKSVKRIDEFAFYSCKQLQIFEIDDNSEIECIHQSIFSDCEKLIVMIPSKLRILFENM